MKTLSLFKQKPKVVKYRPAPKTRLIGSLDLDRKGELEKFKKWLEFVYNEKSDLPKEDEIKKLNKDIEKQPASGFSIASLLSALPFALPGLGALGLGALTAGALVFGDPQKYATRTIIKSLVKGGLKLGKKLLPKGKKVPPVKTSKPPRPGTGGRPRVTGSGGGRAGRPNIRNPFRQRPDVTGSGGGRFGRPDIRNPFRQRPGVTRGLGGQTGKLTIKRILNSLSKKQLIRLAGNLGKKFVLPFVKKVPIIGGLIDFAIRYWIFKEPLDEAIFKTVVSGVGAALGGALGSVFGGLGAIPGAILGGMAGEAGANWLWNAFFKPKAGTDQAKELEEYNKQDDAAGLRGGSEAETPEGDQVTVVDNIKDSNGRPIRLIGPAAAAFKRMAKDAKEEGVDIGPGISSSYRTEADQIRVYKNKYGNDWKKYYVPNSAHMYGEAFDINWNSAAGKWIRANASKYGFQYSTYSGESTHFNWKGGGSASRQSTRAESQSNAPSMPSIPFMEGVSSPMDFLKILGSAFAPAKEAPEVSAVPKQTNIARYTPEAEAANADNVVVVAQAPTPQQPQTGGSQMVPFPIGGSGSSQPVLVSVGALNSLEDLLLTKLDNA